MTVKKNKAAQALRAIKSEKRTETSRVNGKKGGRPKKLPPNTISLEADKYEDVTEDEVVAVEDAEDTQAEDEEEDTPEWE